MEEKNIKITINVECSEKSSVKKRTDCWISAESYCGSNCKQ